MQSYLCLSRSHFIISAVLYFIPFTTESNLLLIFGYFIYTFKGVVKNVNKCKTLSKHLLLLLKLMFVYKLLDYHVDMHNKHNRSENTKKKYRGQETQMYSPNYFNFIRFVDFSILLVFPYTVYWYERMHKLKLEASNYYFRYSHCKNPLCATQMHRIFFAYFLYCSHSKITTAVSHILNSELYKSSDR